MYEPASLVLRLKQKLCVWKYVGGVNREMQESVDISGHFLQLASNSNYGTWNSSQFKHIKQSHNAVFLITSLNKAHPVCLFTPDFGPKQEI